MKHVFVYVIRTAEDLFFGVKRDLAEAGLGSDTYQIHLTENQYDLVRSVEYSGRRFFRILDYREVYRSVEQQILSIAESGAPDEPIVLYSADEGVWGELLSDLRSRLARSRTVLLVNVQHGFLRTEVVRGLWLRRVVNAVSRGVFGYPAVGLGFGGSRLDLYLVYGDVERSFLTDQGLRAVVAPQLIKAELIHRVTPRRQQRDPKSVLVALPASVPGSDMKCTQRQFVATIAPVIRAMVQELGLSVVVRPHPGRGPTVAEKALEENGLLSQVEIDRNENVADSLATHGIVLGSHSTVLFEAAIVGCTPIGIRSDCFDETLPFRHAVVDVRGDVLAQLKAVLGTPWPQEEVVETPGLPWPTLLAEYSLEAAGEER